MLQMVSLWSPHYQFKSKMFCLIFFFECSQNNKHASSYLAGGFKVLIKLVKGILANEVELWRFKLKSSVFGHKSSWSGWDMHWDVETVADPGFPVGWRAPIQGRGSPMWVLFGENVCENKRIGSHGGACPPPQIRQCKILI